MRVSPRAAQRALNVLFGLTILVGVVLWFVVIPIAAARGQGRHDPLWQGFALVWGITLAAAAFVGLLIWLDHRSRSKR